MIAITTNNSTNVNPRFGPLIAVRHESCAVRERRGSHPNRHIDSELAARINLRDIEAPFPTIPGSGCSTSTNGRAANAATWLARTRTSKLAS